MSDQKKYIASLGETVSEDGYKRLRKLPDYVIIGKTATGTHMVRTEWTGVDASNGTADLPWIFKTTVQDLITNSRVYFRNDISTVREATDLHLELVKKYIGDAS